MIKSRLQKAQRGVDHRPAGWAANAFGLSLDADLPVLGFERGAPDADPPHTLIRRVSLESIDATWSRTGAERLIKQHHPDGSVAMTVDAHEELGYRIDAPGYGHFRVTPDGSRLECAPAPGPSFRWHRPLFGQALPLAATLNGFELLHASAVAVDGHAIAFTGHSGAGKTSLAIHLVDQGASLLADDVVALSPDGEEVRAHPGVRFANVAGEQFESVAPDRRARLGRVVGRSEKLHILVDPLADGPARLSALYFLHRRPDTRGLRFERIWPPDPRLLFTATYMPHITASAHVTAQLETCSLIASRVPTFHLHVPPDVDAAALASAVAHHARLSPSS